MSIESLVEEKENLKMRVEEKLKDVMKYIKESVPKGRELLIGRLTYCRGSDSLLEFHDGQRYYSINELCFEDKLSLIKNYKKSIQQHEILLTEEIGRIKKVLNDS